MNRFDSLVESILNEDGGMTAGGSGSVLGSGVVSTSTHISGDNYAKGDARVAKVIGTRVITRNMPKDTIFKGNVKRSKKRRKHKKRKK
jgi:hypothetical protein